MSLSDIPRLRWPIGVEVELLAPPGSSRRTLADRLAAAAGGTVRPFFYPQSDLSLVPGVPVFDNLTLGFEVRDAAGGLIARCVDDLTLQQDLDRERAPVPGWFRVVSDDLRLLHLVARWSSPPVPVNRVRQQTRHFCGMVLAWIVRPYLPPVRPA